MSHHDKTFGITKSNARFRLVEMVRPSLKPKFSQIESIGESLKRDTVSTICIDDLDIDKIESMLDMIGRMNDILCDDPNFNRAMK